MTLINRYLLTLALLLLTFAPVEAGEPEPPDRFTTPLQTVIGGTGGVHILAEPGELIIELEKRDLNESDTERELRAILVGPDRTVVDEQRIADDGLEAGSGMGPAQRITLQTDVERRGVYTLNITVSGGQMETGVVWGFRTNQNRYVVESARGHRDATHEEPILLKNLEESAEVWFRPRRGPFSVEIEDLPDDARDLSIVDSRGEVIETLSISGSEATARLEPGADPEHTPWGIRFDRAQATLHIDGVTRWNADIDSNVHLSHWTFDRDAWFPHQHYRWVLTPYYRRVFGNEGETGHYTFEVYNSAPDERTIELTAEFPQQDFDVEVEPNRLTLPSQESAEVTVRYVIPSGIEQQSVHLRITPLEDPLFSTYSTLEVNAGRAPARESFDPPLVITPYDHENSKLGYVPDYPIDWELYFDLENRPAVRVDDGIKMLNAGVWQTTRFAESVRSDDPHFDGASFDLSRSNTKIAFDDNNDIYMIGTEDGRAALLHSTDGGETFTAHNLGEAGGVDIEDFTGHNIPQGPPAILRSIQTYVDEDHFWRRISDLELVVAEKEDGDLVVRDPILISDRSLGVGSHSGIPSAIVSRGDHIHLIWGEATDPDEDVPGVPTFVTTYNRSTGELEGEPVLIGYGPPANNVHNRPSITIDSEGYLHAIIGTHGQPFLYAQSLEPNTAHGGWSEPEMLAEDDELRQTYVGLVSGPDNTLHLVYRLWRYQEEPHPKSHHAVLAYQQKPPGESWSEPRALFVPPFSEYSIFYHRLGIDMQGRLMLSYDYWSTFWFYRNDFRESIGHHRKTILSEDDGDTWRLLYTDEL